jgi:uncharacterized ubiquitin-like protein YukD
LISTNSDYLTVKKIIIIIILKEVKDNEKYGKHLIEINNKRKIDILNENDRIFTFEFHFLEFKKRKKIPIQL